MSTNQTVCTVAISITMFKMFKSFASEQLKRNLR